MEPGKLYLEIINNLPDGVYFVDMERRITFWNRAAEDITGYKADEILGQRCQDNLLNHIDRDGRQLCLYGCPLYASIIDGHQRTDEVLLRHKKGYRIPVRVNIFPIRDEGNIVGAVEIFTPSSPTVYEDDLVENLSNIAMSDALTGLANRRKVETYLEYRLHELRRFESRFCVVFFDIDNFSAFNDQYGHQAGDNVLVSVSKTIKRNLRKTDMVGRWGGEEFIGVFEITNDYEAALMAEKLRVLIAKSEVVHGRKALSVSASLGATVGRSEDTLEAIVARVDGLMYQSKQKGKNCVSTDC